MKKLINGRWYFCIDIISLKRAVIMVAWIAIWLCIGILIGISLSF